MAASISQKQQQQQQHLQQHHHSNRTSSVDEEDEDDEDEDLDEEEEEDDIYMDQQQQHNQNDLNQINQDDEADRASDSSFSDSVSLSSTPSIPCSDDIDFTLVYALHTFLATVEGQASVVKGDRLTLLDDTNSYWWLIRVLKTLAVGYIPAENIETPFERLARLNKHRNVDLSSATPVDVQAGAASSLAQTRFSQRIPSAGDPVRSRSPQDRRKGPAPPPMVGPGYFSPPPVAPAPGTGKGKTVAFTAPTYFENSGNEWSDEDDVESGNEHMIDRDEVEGDWDGEGEFEEGEEGFEDEEEESDEDEEEQDQDQGHFENATAPQRPERAPVLELDPALKANSTIDSQRQLEEQLAQEHKQQQQRQYQLQQQIQHQVASEQSLSRQTSVDSEEAGKSPSGWARLRLAARASADSLRGGPGNSNKEDSRSQLGKGLSPVQRAQLDSPSANKESTPEQPAAPRTVTQAPLSNGSKNASSISIDRIASTSSLQLIPNAHSETKKLTLTPDIARDTADYSLDVYQPSPSRGSHPTRQRSTSSSSSESPLRQSSSKQPARVNGEPSSASFEAHSADSHNGTAEDAKSSKQTNNKKEDSDTKKKKTGGLLSGFFGRKKDKKSKNDPLDDTRSSSLEHDRNRSSSPLSPSEHSVRSLSSPQHMEGSPGGNTSGRRPAPENDDLFSTDAALRKQQEEAQEVMNRQYGISREINDFHGTSQQQKKPSYPPLNSNVPPTSLGLHSPFSPGSSTASMKLAYSPAGGKVRPGSLIGSPGIAGLDVPMLNVLRIFAGDNVDCEATFKTVLLSAQTTTQELITQSLQRFQVSVNEEDRPSYYLTIKDVVSGEETILDDQQTPLKLFELMNESLGQNALHLPSVKRSSVGSISSISSNLSLNPAISRLGMNDFSDDSAVKFHLNRYPDLTERNHSQGNFASSNPVPSSRKPERTGSLAPIQENGATSAHRGTHPISTNNSRSPSTQYDPQKPLSAVSNSDSTDSMHSEQLTLSPGASSPSTTTITTTTSPSLRFAMRVRIHSSDLPEGLVFDPQSNAIIPKTVLVERGQRPAPPANLSSTASSSTLANSFREKVIIFPRNIHVSEAIEHTLEAFGIADGVVDGGDDVDDKISKRRNSSKIRYGLSMKSPDSPTEVPVNLISKVLDAYSVQPIFRPADRTSKEARRRSQEYHPFVLGTLQDLQPSDPIFSLRRALLHHPPRRDHARNLTGQNGLAGVIADELGLLQAKKTSLNGSSRPAPSTQSSFKTAQESIHSVDSGLLNATPPVSSPNPLAVLSTQRNSEEGIDVNLRNNSMIRSRRDDGAQRSSYRYSYIDPSGEEHDISSLIESELSSELSPRRHRKTESQDRTAGPRNASPSTEDGYASAPESPLSSVNPLVMRQLQQHQTDDDSAIEALRVADLTIDQELRLAPSRQTSRDLHPSEDLLAWTVRKQGYHHSEHPSDSQRGSSKSSPFFAESLDQRIQRVLSKVKPSKNGGLPWSMENVQQNSKMMGAEQRLNGTGVPKTGAEEVLRGSVGSSRSNSTNEDGSMSPVTPLTATSPTGESSNYTPISSATRGRGIDSRLSMNREQGPIELRGPPASTALGFPVHNRSWLPLLFPSLTPSSTNSSTTNGLEGTQNFDRSGAGLDILMNLILLSAASASSSSSATPSSSSASSSSSTTTTTTSNPKAVHRPDKAPSGLWTDDPSIALLFNELNLSASPKSSSSALPLHSFISGSKIPPLFSSNLSSNLLLSRLDHAHESNQDSSNQDSSNQDSSNQDSSNHLDSSNLLDSSSSFVTDNNHPSLLHSDDIDDFFNQASNSFDKIDKVIDRILLDSLKL